MKQLIYAKRCMRVTKALDEPEELGKFIYRT